MLLTSTLEQLQAGPNLLAFSGGVDSSALFFLLLQANISFDITIVNYQTREQSEKEVAYAQALAEKYDKKCHLLVTTLTDVNFEATARHLRYDFFEELIQTHHYTNLITAHQLDDRLEWLLMQLSKGAGLYELLGSQAIETRDGYTLVRPLLETTKTELRAYLALHKIRFFEDASNNDEKYKRNFFRHNLAEPLLKQYGSGIKKSFTYLDEDLNALHQDSITIESINALYYFNNIGSRRSAVIAVDKLLKTLDFLMRQGDKEALKESDEHVVGRKHVVSFHKEFCFIAPYLSNDMSKEFKEQCRVLKVPQKLRPYLFEDGDAFEVVRGLLTLDNL